MRLVRKLRENTWNRVCEVREWNQPIFAIGLLLGSLILAPGMLLAAEPVSEFLNGLNRRGYTDTALYYLELIESDQQLPAPMRELLPFQRAVTLTFHANQTRRRSEQIECLQSAEKLLSEFLKQHPAHLHSEQAGVLRSKVQLELAQRKIIEGESSSVARNEPSLSEIRQQIGELRVIFVQQCERYERDQEQYPAYISQEEPELRRARDRGQEFLIRSQLDLAQCDYWEAHTYPVDHEDRLRLLTTAGSAYEAIHQRHRSQLGGLYARLWQGKCYEELRSEQGIRLALGIYGEILKHDGTSLALVVLKDRALLFRLICLNTPFRKDYQLVDMEAEKWLTSAGERIDSETGLGIQWELCQALEFLSQEKKWAPEIRRDSLLRARNRMQHLLKVTGGQIPEFEEFRKRVASQLEAAGLTDSTGN